MVVLIVRIAMPTRPIKRCSERPMPGGLIASYSFSIEFRRRLYSSRCARSRWWLWGQRVFDTGVILPSISAQAEILR